MVLVETEGEKEDTEQFHLNIHSGFTSNFTRRLV